jgi:gliding motility-associated-like protein
MLRSLLQSRLGAVSGVFALFLSPAAFSQLTITTTSTINTNCNGTDCDYSGPSILINELMISPTSNDGSISGYGGVGEGRGEWIELYNPNLCEPIDISCYYLGNYTAEGGGGFQLPDNTVIPPAGFCMVRGANMSEVDPALLVQNGGNVVEVEVPFDIFDIGVCVSGGTRLWFPNAGGWFAFYDDQGIPQDAVSWGSTNNSSFGGFPCVPANTNCNTGVLGLSSYSNIDPARKTHVNTSLDAGIYLGQSLHRTSDGGSWAIDSPGQPTYATCNAACFDPGTSTCTGTATASVTGGTPPYSYLWNDSQAQLTQTAIELCEGTYTVTVTDANNLTATQTVTIANNVPAVNFTVPEEICVNETVLGLLPGASPAPGGGATGTFTGTGVSGNNFNASNAGAGTATITYNYTDAFGCMNNASDQIVVNPLPTGSIVTETPYCFSNTPQSFTLTPAGGTLSGPGITSNAFIPSQAGLGNHTVTYAFSDANGCSNTTTATVFVVANPSPTMSYPDLLCIHDDAVSLAADPSGGEFEIDGQSAASFDPQELGEGEHFIGYEYTNPNGCIAFAIDSITVLPRPALTIDLAANYCEGTPAAALDPSPAGGTLTGDFVSGTGLVLENAAAGSYAVQYAYTDANGCENTLNQNYTISPALHPDFGYSVNCAQVAAFSNLTSAQAASYSWVVDAQPVSNNANPSVPFSLPGDHTVTLSATDLNNCTYDTTIIIYVKPGIAISDIAVANVITANKDGVNDFIEFPADFLECYSYTMVILNRWGNVVYEMSNTNNRFSGESDKGKELPEGVYFYRIESPDIDCDDPLWKPICSGNITIAR